MKFTPKSGKVIIATNPVSEGWVEISVNDTGIWMNQEMKENLFKLDVNTSRKGTENEPSPGLGLIICKEFVEKNGGRLTYPNLSFPLILSSICRILRHLNKHGDEKETIRAGHLVYIAAEASAIARI